MYSNYPPDPYDTRQVQPDRTAFLDALTEMSEDVQKDVHSIIWKLAYAILDKQDKHFKNMNAAYNDAVFVVSRIIWKIGA